MASATIALASAALPRCRCTVRSRRFATTVAVSTGSGLASPALPGCELKPQLQRLDCQNGHTCRKPLLNLERKGVPTLAMDHETLGIEVPLVSQGYRRRTECARGPLSRSREAAAGPCSGQRSVNPVRLPGAGISTASSRAKLTVGWIVRQADLVREPAVDQRNSSRRRGGLAPGSIFGLVLEDLFQVGGRKIIAPK